MFIIRQEDHYNLANYSGSLVISVSHWSKIVQNILGTFLKLIVLKLWMSKPCDILSA